MDIYIKTLTGTIFELRVSPFETIFSIKAKLQRDEGIPITQQHLIWRSTELDDEYCLHDYGIRNEATLTMVLAMRDGPINMRRVSVEETSMEEVEEYMNGNMRVEDEIWDKILNDDKQVTLLVFRDGDQLNFFRVYDRGDGTLSPYSESIESPESIYNAYPEEDTSNSKTQVADNVITRDKMKVLLSQMNEKSSKKKKPTQPRPPSVGKPNGTFAKRRIHFSKPPTVLSRHSVIPKTESKLEVFEGTPSPDKFDPLNSSHLESSAKRTLPPIQKEKDSTRIDVTDFTTKNPDERKTSSSFHSNIAECATERSLTSTGRESVTSNMTTYQKLPSLDANRSKKADKDDIQQPSRARHRILKPLAKMARSDANEMLTEVRSPPHYEQHRHTRLASTSYDIDDVLKDSQLSEILRDPVELENYKKLLKWVQPRTNSGGYRDLRQSNKSPSRNRRRTPDGGRLTARHHSAAKIHPHGNLPSLHHEKRHPPSLTGKKKPRCLICRKKLGLATTYQCRCAGKFCAIHRYPETHTCTYDYKMEGRKILEKSNPVVTAPKLPKI